MILLSYSFPDFLLAKERGISGAWFFFWSALIEIVSAPISLLPRGQLDELSGVTDQCLVLRSFTVLFLVSFTHSSLRGLPRISYTYLRNPSLISFPFFLSLPRWNREGLLPCYCRVVLEHSAPPIISVEDRRGEVCCLTIVE